MTSTSLADATSTDAAFAEIVDELTRRGLLAGGIGTLGVLSLTACGGSSEKTAGPTSSASARRTVESAYGRVEVPAEPKRVVALSKAAIATLLDVGLTPIGTDDDEAPVALPQYQKTIAALPTVGSYGKFNVEKIAALRPDLVISYDTYLDADLYAQVSTVAPTVAVKTDKGNISWQDATATFAAAVNRSTQLDVLATTYAARIASVAKRYADQLAGNRWEVVQNAGTSNFFRYLPSSDPSGILARLGARLGNAAATGPNYWGKEHSYETLDGQLGHAEVILYVKVNSNELVSQQLWRDLPAVGDGHAYGTDLLFPASYSGAIALVDLIAGVCRDLR